LLSLETLETLDALETALEMLEIESRLICRTLQLNYFLQTNSTSFNNPCFSAMRLIVS